jgi:hypothetical protein
MDGNVTRAGITADLEAMQRVGIGGAHIFNVSYQIPHGDLKYATPEWFAMMEFAAREADRLGLELAMHNCSGWSSSGGPWIAPENSMRKIVWTETQVNGPAHLRTSLSRPAVPQYRDYYRDIAVLACKTPAAEAAGLNLRGAKISTSGSGLKSNQYNAATGALNIEFAPPSDERPEYIQIEFADPFVARSLLMNYTSGHGDIHCTLQSSNDGLDFMQIAVATIKGSGQLSVSFPECKGRVFRLLMTGKPFDDGVPLNVLALALQSGYRLPDWPAKAGFVEFGNSGFVPAWDEKSPDDGIYAREDVVDITASLRGDTLEWSVPEGSWTILRMGYTPNGRPNTHPEDAGKGLEVDKLSRAALEQHFDHFIDTLLREMGPLKGHSFTTLLIDSYEVGPQNWTPEFRDEFQRLRGYDLTLLLPALTGRAIQSPEFTEQFLWDFRRTIADLFEENYYGYFRELCRQRGIKAAFEAYVGPFSIMDCSERADLPMGEFWTGGAYTKSNSRNRLVVSGGHMAKKNVIGAEAFTSGWGEDRFTQDPYSLKALGDFQFCEGINRFIFHEYAMQPWMDHRPGMTMGPWGLHLGRNVTWWEQGRAWMEYLARCQYLLQAGTPVADILVFSGEDAQSEARWGSKTAPTLPEGYDFEFANLRVLQRSKVADGLIVAQNGQTFRILVLPESLHLTMEALTAIARLVHAGAIVVGPRPVRLVGLANADSNRATFVQIVRDLWDTGKVIHNMSLATALQRIAAVPDVSIDNSFLAERISFKHRSADGAEIYFISNQRDEPATIAPRFRISGRVPELWHLDTGLVKAVPVFSEEHRTTRVSLHLPPCGSIFVIFRKPVTGNHIVSATGDPDELAYGAHGLMFQPRKEGRYEFATAAGSRFSVVAPAPEPPVDLTDGWKVSFPPNLGAPASIDLSRLQSLARCADQGVRYFSGTATYHRRFQISADQLTGDRDVFLDLGAVKNIAEVKVNGVDCGILWKPPFEMCITSNLRAGENSIEVAVTNLWVNRLIGDEQLPDDCEWIAIPGRGWMLRQWPEWFVEKKPRPSGRIAFATWRWYTKDDPVPDSGLIGPVLLRTVRNIRIDEV